MKELLSTVTGLRLVDQMSQNSNYNPWYNPMITAKQSSWIDTAANTVANTISDPNYKTLRKRKYLNYN